jgi:hypothetical protein
MRGERARERRQPRPGAQRFERVQQRIRQELRALIRQARARRHAHEYERIPERALVFRAPALARELGEAPVQRGVTRHEHAVREQLRSEQHQPAGRQQGQCARHPGAPGTRRQARRRQARLDREARRGVGGSERHGNRLGGMRALPLAA